MECCNVALHKHLIFLAQHENYAHPTCFICAKSPVRHLLQSFALKPRQRLLVKANA
jgi:hypothetical protein